MFAYFPYIVPYTGALIPTLGLAFTGVSSLFTFAVQDEVKSVRIVEDGRVEIKYSVSPVITKTIYADLGQIHSVMKDAPEGQILVLSGYTADGQEVNEQLSLQLTNEGWKDYELLDYILSEKTGSDLELSFANLLNSRQVAFAKGSSLSQALTSDIELFKPNDLSLGALIDSNNPKIEGHLNQLVEEYGVDHLKQLSNGEFY